LHVSILKTLVCSFFIRSFDVDCRNTKKHHNIYPQSRENEGEHNY
jgi:hypothetical protein